MSRSPSLEECFCKLHALVMVSVPWSDSGSETGGFGMDGGEVLIFF